MDFAAYLESMTTLHVGELPPHAYMIPFDITQQVDEDRRRSSRYISLNGEWAFAYASSVHNLGDAFDPFLAELTERIAVPSVWQLQGYDAMQYVNKRYPFPYDPPYLPAENPCGLYRRSFSLSETEGCAYTLCFDGVDSCFFLWLNGEFVGYSTVSHSPAEFDVTSRVHAGENTVCVLVVKWCFGSYLEDQDKFRYTGIFRDVYLLRRDAVHLTDFTVQTSFSEDYARAALSVDLELNAPACACTGELRDPSGQLIRRAEGNRRLTFDIEHPILWTAETPALYTLTLCCGAERIAHRIGLRRIEIREGTVLLNGRPVHLHGVNLHESRPETGAYVPEARLLEDLCLMKRHNINAIRTSHYPQPPRFYELCDRLGFYVMDEADLECHGVTMLEGVSDKGEAYNLIANDLAFMPAILDRVERMVKRDKNFTCVLIDSMGNESGYGINLEKALEWTKKAAPDRLTHYERASFPPQGWDIEKRNLDLYSRMYPSIEEIRRYFAEGRVNKPYILCEYAHAMGNGPGDLEDYFQLFEEEPRICGGFIWEWCDHAPAVRTDGGAPVYRYGGDFGERLHDGNYCVDGLVSQTRRIKAGLEEYKNVLRPLRAVAFHPETGEITLKNQLDFERANRAVRLTCTIRDRSGRETAYPVADEALNIAPGKTAVLRVPPFPGGSCVLHTTLRRDKPWAKAGYPLGVEQLGRAEAGIALPPAPSGRVHCRQQGRMLLLSGTDFRYVYDPLTAAFVSLDWQGSPLLTEPMRFNVYRAPTDNDRKTSVLWERYRLRDASARGLQTQVTRQGEDVTLRTAFHLGAPSVRILADGEIRWTVGADGRIAVSLAVRRRENIPAFPRIGIRLFLPAALNRVSYFGLGPRESYVDKHRSCVRGWYEGAVGDDYDHPLRPQESGSHACVDLLTLRGGGLALSVSGRDFCFSALPYSQEQLADARHDDELAPEARTILCLDAAQRGIGSHSCGPELDARYETPACTDWRFALFPGWDPAAAPGKGGRP